MQQKIQYNTIYSSHRYYRRFFKNFPTFHILKTQPPITYILSSLSILSILEQLPFHMFQNRKKKKERKKQLCFRYFQKSPRSHAKGGLFTLQ